MAYKPTYVTIANPKAPSPYRSGVKAPTAYKPVTNNVKAYTPGAYRSQYQGQLDNAMNTVTNWKYDPMQDASYQALAKIYGERGNRAAKNTLADAAALNGGMQTSYAVSAAQQARNQYNQELAALVPELERTAYDRAQSTYNILKGADDTAYGRFRDTEADKQWKYSQDYQAYRDREADNQWRYSQAYQAYRDRETDSQWAYSQLYDRYKDALAQYQWGLNYNTDLYYKILAEEAAGSSGGGGGGGGGGRRSGGGGSYGGSSRSSGGNQNSSGGASGDVRRRAENQLRTPNPNSVMAYQPSKNKKAKTNYPTR